MQIIHPLLHLNAQGYPYYYRSLDVQPNLLARLSDFPAEEESEECMTNGGSKLEGVG